MTPQEEALAREQERRPHLHNPPRIARTVPPVAQGAMGDRPEDSGRDNEQAKVRQEVEQKAFFAMLDKWFAAKMEEQEIRRVAAEQKTLLNIPSRPEVFGALRGIIKGIQEKFTLRTDMKKAMGVVLQDVYNRKYVTQEEAKKIAREAVPLTLRGLDGSGDKRTGHTLLLAVGGASGTDSAYWGPGGGGLSAKGDKVLYKGVFLREYDEDGVIVAAGSDLDPSDYTTQDEYEAALTAAGHTLKPTWDWMRTGTDITS